MMPVIDKDMGYNAILRAFARAEGIVGWVGILSGRIYYPKTYRSWKYGADLAPKIPRFAKRKGKRYKRSGRAEVAKVAAVLQAEGGWVSQAIDENMGVWDREWNKAAQELLAGGDPADAMANFCRKVRDTMRKELAERFHMRSRKLWKTIGFRVGVPAQMGRSGQQPRWVRILRQRGAVSRL